MKYHEPMSSCFVHASRAEPSQLERDRAHLQQQTAAACELMLPLVLLVLEKEMTPSPHDTDGTAT